MEGSKESTRTRVVDIDVPFFSLLWLGVKVAAVGLLIGAALGILGTLVSFLMTAVLIVGAAH